MGKYESGQNKPKGSGRKKGTPNKRSQYLAEVLEASNIDIPRKLIELLPKLSASKRADVLMGLMPYLFPKRRPIEGLSSESSNQEIKVIFVSPQDNQAII